MRKNKLKLAKERYIVLGKALSACASGIVGFSLGGLVLAIPCVFIGSICSHYLGKIIFKGHII